MFRLFTDHPHSVGETYLEHFHFAARFGARLLVAGAACVVHGFLPFIFLTTGSRTVHELHGAVNQGARGQLTGDGRGLPEPEYSI